MKNFPWLQGYLDQWLELILSNKVPHAILLYGAKGLAKRELAQSMAHYAICENLSEKGVCNTCKGCHLFNSGNHTDVKTITAEKQVIKVEQIRNLTKDVVLSSTRNQHRIIIIENAEKMNKASANALLKTLEEPPTNVVIILTTSEIGYLLPTIKSRCFKVGIKTVDVQQLKKYLLDCNVGTIDEVNQAIILANYAPIVAKNIIENNTLTVIKSMLNDLNQIAAGQKTVIEISKQWIKNEQTEYLFLIATYFLSTVKSNNGLDQNNSLLILSNSDYSGVNNHNEKTLNFIRSIFKFMSRQRTALKIELLLEELLIDWQNDFQN